jgi:hypothetical protein
MSLVDQNGGRGIGIGSTCLERVLFMENNFLYGVYIYRAYDMIIKLCLSFLESSSKYMIKSFHYLSKTAALIAASLILPALAYADRDNHGRGGHERGGERQGDPRVSSVPEPNTAWVLLPFVGAVLVVGSMHLWRQQKNASI